jgi:hypothetical protein
MKSRKIEPVDDGASATAMYGIVPGLIIKKSVDTLISALDQNLKVRKLDMLKEYGVDTPASAFLTDADSVTGQKTIVFTEGESRCKTYRSDYDPELVVILGAGNQTFLSALDALYYLFVEGHVCVVKHHPLMLPSKPYFDQLFEPLIRAGFIASVEASPQLASALIHSPLTDAVHLTGGIATHDAIVFGTGADAETRRREGRPLLRARMVSELGCITPYIILPGPAGPGGDDGWTDAAIARHTAACAEGLANNVSCNCLATKVSRTAAWHSLLFVRHVSHPELDEQGASENRIALA